MNIKKAKELRMSDGYIFQEEEWKRYHDFKPSIFQRIFWIFWPTLTSIKWNACKDVNFMDFSMNIAEKIKKEVK